MARGIKEILPGVGTAYKVVHGELDAGAVDGDTLAPEVTVTVDTELTASDLIAMNSSPLPLIPGGPPDQAIIVDSATFDKYSHLTASRALNW